MSEAYVECLVKARTSGIKVFLKYLLFMLTGATFILAILSGMILLLILAVIIGVLAYFVNLNSDVEYEYLYLDKEFSVDKIFGKTKRKKAETFEVERMEILAPIHSYHLDSYKNRNAKETDYSIGVEEKPDSRYVMYYEGNRRIVLSPNEEFVKAMRNASPRKVFTD